MVASLPYFVLFLCQIELYGIVTTCDSLDVVINEFALLYSVDVIKVYHIEEVQEDRQAREC